ncbi:recombinase family protein [Aeromicrobium ponti]|uniref:DNA invertase Pin-like site-specific DNA recombinase n=1 Tax=Cytobacillus oceanisediminis TaxID=665099 RepID=A0A562K0Y8_9BACI|nr:recombinase family protein [Cytobacillus oceanisediminis]TWH88913.1 DNA invertase Pin-like site-specific DNA recombinase [Cytobacillus oceanisediminis]
MDVAVYTRVSTKHEEQLSSMENQKRHYIDFCDRNNYNLVKLYSDEGLSATSPKRKEYLEMIYDAGLDFIRDKNSNEILYFKLSERTPKFDLIITKDVSRFARNTDAIVLARKLREKGVYVLFENAGFSTDDNDWELRLSLLLTFSQQESIDRSKKVAFAYKQRSKSGIFHLARNLYGYKYNPETKIVSVVEEEAEVIRKMFDLYINGYGVKNISNYLNENNIKTQNGKEWVGGNVRRLLRNEKYIGRVILNKYTNSGITGSNKKIKRPESEWVIHEDAIPAIIDMDTWNKAQEVISKRVDQSKEGSLTGSRKVKNIFYNKLYCGRCGKPFVRVSATKERSYGTFVQYNYICSNRRQRKSCDNTMKTHGVLEKRINEFAANELPNVLMEKRDMLKRIISIEKKMLTGKMKLSERMCGSIKKKIAQIDDEVNKLITAFAKSSSTVVSVIEKKIEELELTKQELNNQLLDHDVISIESKINQLDDSYSDLDKMVKEEYSFEEALKYIGKITVDGDDISFNVLSDGKLEPLLNIDVNKIGQSNLEKLIKETKELLKS